MFNSVDVVAILCLVWWALGWLSFSVSNICEHHMKGPIFSVALFWKSVNTGVVCQAVCKIKHHMTAFLEISVLSAHTYAHMHMLKGQEV